MTAGGRRFAALADAELVADIRQGVVDQPALIDEYYRRCIPIYLEVLGIHWHTGWYESSATKPSPRDQERMIERIASAAAIRPGMRVLDVGCGVGGTVGWLAIHRSAEVVGLTPVPEQKLLAERWLAVHGPTPTPRIELGRAESLPFADSSFDAIVFFESICHVHNRSRFMHEAFRVLRPGGRIAGEDWLRVQSVSSPDHSTLIERVERLWAIPALAVADDYLAMMQNAGFQDCAYQDLRDVSALDRGFAVEAAQRQSLNEQLRDCDNPLLALILEGLIALGEAAQAHCFTIGSFQATRPAA